ncbi:Hypothetical predicted protein, partial [Mytilus galloprovincialis]
VFYCCANYEERNNACVACKIGFKSRNGQPCTPCKYKFYGNGCVSQCNCNLLQRCDNIKGCVSRQTATLSTKHHNAGIYIRDLLVSSGSITAGIIASFGFCYCYNKHKRKTAINSPSANINDRPPAENDDVRNETFELNESLYHTIDENNMVNLVLHENPYLEVVDESQSSDKLTSSSESMKSSNSSTSGYLHPYHSFIATLNDHPYDQIQPVKEADDPTTTHITDNQYQECVTPLENMTDKVNHPQRRTNHLIRVCVHEGEGSGLNSEKR